MQGKGFLSHFSRTAFRAALCALCLWNGAAWAFASPSAPTEDVAQTILGRLVTLHEGAGLESFAQLDDALLDRVAKTVLARGFSPVAQSTLNRQNRPELFQDAAGKDCDLALPRDRAASIAAWFLGRPAPLQGEGEYVYGVAADGPLLCEARLKSVEKGLVRGAMFCTPAPGEPAVHRAELEARLAPEPGAPQGWVVEGFSAIPVRDKASAPNRKRPSIFIYDGFLLGAYPGTWIDGTQLQNEEQYRDIRLWGGESARVYGFGGFGGEAVLLAPAADHPAEEFADQSGLPGVVQAQVGQGKVLGIGDARLVIHVPAENDVPQWEPMPRQPKALSVENAQYRKIMADYLAGKGLKGVQARLTQVWRVDLEGDGVDEVLLAATNLQLDERTSFAPDQPFLKVLDPDGRVNLMGKVPGHAQKGDYAVLLLRKVIDGKVRNIPIRECIATKASSPDDADWTPPFVYRACVFADLNGDGNMEIITGQANYESLSYIIHEVRGDKVIETARIAEPSLSASQARALVADSLSVSDAAQVKDEADFAGKPGNVTAAGILAVVDFRQHFKGRYCGQALPPGALLTAWEHPERFRNLPKKGNCAEGEPGCEYSHFVSQEAAGLAAACVTGHRLDPQAVPDWALAKNGGYYFVHDGQGSIVWSITLDAITPTATGYAIKGTAQARLGEGDTRPAQPFRLEVAPGDAPGTWKRLRFTHKPLFDA